MKYVIFPFTLLRCLDCVLELHRDSIAEELEKVKDKPDIIQKHTLDKQLNHHGLSLYKKLLGAPDQIGTSFQTYLNGFTENVKDIHANFIHSDSQSDNVDLSPIYARLDRHDNLFSVVQMCVQRADLHPDKVSNAMMGTVFEIVIRRSKEANHTKAGQFYTPREIVLTTCGRKNMLYDPGRRFKIYDPCCGTGDMLTIGRDYLQEISGRDDLFVYLYG